MSTKYDADSFGDRSNSLKSAKVIIPITLEFFQPTSVVDVGCGTGEFLSVFKKNGVKEILGIDGPWVDKEKLRIPKECFQKKNLERSIKINKRFDLAVSLEVAEHLSPKAAKTFVKTLTGFAPVVLFSAAIPFQGGLYHLNEQWPEYWAKLFAQKGYYPVDCIRKKIWNNDNVSYWYAQNTLLFVEKNYLETNDVLKREYEKTEPSALSLVHPKLFTPKARRLDTISKLIPKPIRRGVTKLVDLFK